MARRTVPLVPAKYFDQVARKARLTEEMAERARRVMVEGEPVIRVASESGVSRTAVYTALKRIEALMLEPGYERVELVLPLVLPEKDARLVERLSKRVGDQFDRLQPQAPTRAEARAAVALSRRVVKEFMDTVSEFKPGNLKNPEG